MPTSVMVIVGSTRRTRIGRGIADAIADILTEDPEVTVDLADLAEIHLPLADEPMLPRLGDYRLPSTKAWSQRVVAADAVVLVTPEYNGGYPASVKNALDALGPEWVGKPFAVASYGGHGGTRAFRQVSEIITNVGADLVEVGTGVHLAFGREDLDDRMRLTDPVAFVGRHREAVVATAAELVTHAGTERAAQQA